MKNVILVILSGILITLAGCTSENNSVENDLKKGNIKGDVIFIKEISKDLSGDNTQINITEYNESGNIKVELNSSKYQNELKEYEYNENKVNRIIVNVVDAENNKIEGVMNYFYNPNGLLIKISPNNITFDENKKLSLIESSTTFEHESKNISKEIYSLQGEKFRTTIYYRTKQLDSSLNIIKLVDYESKTGVNYFYDDYGNQIQLNYEDSFGGKVIRKNTYTYDSYGNWIKKIESANGKEENVIERKIYYKGDDFAEIKSEFENFRMTILSNTNNSKVGTKSNKSQTQSNYNNNSSSNTYQQPERQKCKKCNGTGRYFCQMCNGNGVIKCTNFCINGRTQLANEESKTCYKCNGTMRLNCYNCNGRGNAKCYECIDGYISN